MNKTFLLLLLLASCLRADLVVSGGYMVVSGGTVRESSKTTVQSGATLQLDSGSELISPLVEILVNGLLRGCGIVTGDVHNLGQILAACGTGETLQIDGNLTNDGDIQAKNNTGFTVSGSVVNNGLLDLIFSPSALPTGITGTGTEVTAATLPAIDLDTENGELVVPAFPGHLYRVEYTDDLTTDPVVWSEGNNFTVESASTITVPVPVPSTGLRVYRYRME